MVLLFIIHVKKKSNKHNGNSCNNNKNTLNILKMNTQHKYFIITTKRKNKQMKQTIVKIEYE